MMRQPLLEELIVYLRLARACKDRMQMPEADRFLIIAGACASLLGMNSIARLCRQQVVGRNPGHQLARFASLDEALRDAGFQTLLGQLMKKHPPDAAVELARQIASPFRKSREDFDSDTGFAAAAFGVDPEWLDECFGDDD